MIPKQIKGAEAPIHSHSMARIFDICADVPDV